MIRRAEDQKCLDSAIDQVMMLATHLRKHDARTIDLDFVRHHAWAVMQFTEDAQRASRMLDAWPTPDFARGAVAVR